MEHEEIERKTNQDGSTETFWPADAFEVVTDILETAVNIISSIELPNIDFPDIDL